MRDLRLSILGLLVMTIILICPKSALAQDCEAEKRDPVSGEELVEMLSSQQRVVIDCAQIIGDINLLTVPTTRGPFSLTNSLVEGALIAPFTIFKGTVDFTNTTFSGEANQPNLVDLRGSVFEGDVLWLQAEFETGMISEIPPSVDVRHARFQGITDLRGAVFHVPVQFENTTFEGRASFQRTQFHETVRFDRTAFEDRALFMDSRFEKQANFEGMSVEKDADFTDASFLDMAMFRDLSVMGRLSMLKIYFGERAILDRVFVGELKLGNNDFVEGAELSMADIRADSLEMDLDDVVRIDNDYAKIAVLEVVERTALNKGSMEIANDALFRRRVLEKKNRGQVLQIPNRIFNEVALGYPVRPLRPLLSMLIVVLFGWLVRLAREFQTLRVDERETTLRLDERLAVSLGALGASLRVVLSPKPNIPKPEDRLNLQAYAVATAQWVEWVGQKVLLAFFSSPSPISYQQLGKLLPLYSSEGQASLLEDSMRMKTL